MKNAGPLGGPALEVEKQTVEAQSTKTSLRLQAPLIAEWLATSQPSDKQLAYLVAHGVTIEATIRAGGLGIAKIATVGNTWHPDPAGQGALILPVWNHPAPSPWHAEKEVEVIDLIALHPTEADSWWRRRGAAGGLLGHEHLDQHEAGDHLDVYASPLDWLRAGCQGAVFLDWAANLRDRRRLREKLEIAA